MLAFSLQKVSFFRQIARVPLGSMYAAGELSCAICPQIVLWLRTAFLIVLQMRTVLLQLFSSRVQRRLVVLKPRTASLIVLRLCTASHKSFSSCVRHLLVVLKPRATFLTALKLCTTYLDSSLATYKGARVGPRLCVLHLRTGRLNGPLPHQKGYTSSKTTISSPSCRATEP